MNRRDFHSGSLAHTAGQLLGPLLDLTQSAPRPENDVCLLRFSRRAMATHFEVLLAYDEPGAEELADIVFDRIDQLEAQMTVYRDDSEVTRINEQAARDAVVVEAGLFDLLARAARISAATAGAFDVTAGPLIKAWGFFRREGRVPSPAERQDALARVGMRHVELDATRRSVRFRRGGMELNLGSIGKGHALDEAAGRLRERGVHSALLHGGGSSVYALGPQPGSTRGWPVGVRHPWDENRRIAVVRLRDRALATSAATHQHFDYNSRKLGHLLDPRTGRPAEGIASASALAPTAAEADALATAFYVLGLDKTRLYCQAHPGIGAILLPDGAEAAIVVGLGADDVTLPGVSE